MRPFLLSLALVALPQLTHAAAEADLLIAYDNGYSDSVGGNANAEVLAANAVASSNLINDRSGTGARMRICGYHKTWWQAGRSTLGGYVGWMNNYGDGNLDDVTTAADARGADLVAFICAPSSGETAAAVAHQPGRYAAYGPGNFWANVVAHETGGHNYGCDHRDGRQDPKTIMLHNYCGGGSQGWFSNPNIWLNGTKLKGEGSCLGATAGAAGDNAYLISSAAQGVADRKTRVIVSPKLGNVVRRWKFNQAATTAPTGTTITDDVTGTALATVQGNGATFTGSGLAIPGGSSESGAAYLQLPSGILSAHTHITLEVWATPLSSRSWARILDFNDSSTNNYLILTSSNGTDLNNQRFESKFGGATPVFLDSGLATVAGVPHHYALTFVDNGSGGGTWFFYRDGDFIAKIDVAYTLASFPDLNNWLGRSAYSGDDRAHCAYSEVRLSNIAMSRDEILANYLLGPNHDNSVNVTLGGSDSFGTSSFNQPGQWSNAAAPSGANSYETHGFDIRTPGDSAAHTFSGNALSVSGGRLLYKGSNSATTINNLSVEGPTELVQAGSGTWTLAGSLDVVSDEAQVRAANGAINLATNLSGNGNLLFLNNTVTLSGSNAGFTGKTIVGDGRFSRLSIDSENRLGSNPSAFTADQLTLNRGILYNSDNVAIDDNNRGLRIGASAGIFNVTPETTVTIAVPVSGTSSGSALQTAPLYPNPVAGMLVKENSGTLALTHPNNSHAGEIVISGGTLAVNGSGRLNNGDHFMPLTNNGVLSFASSSDQTIGGVISGNGSLQKSGTGTLTLTAANTLSGNVTINAGTIYANPGNAATNRAFSHISGITVNNGGTLRASANGLFGWDGSQEKPVTVNAGGTLTTNGGLTSDVGLGLLTLHGGTLASLAGGATDWGSWRFDEGSDKLLVTADSTVSATHVKFGHANAAIEVASGQSLDFTGTITDANNGGISYLRKTGTGTLVLANTNTHTGATSLDAGTTLVNGSLGNTAVTVASGATLGGSGSIGGAATINGTHSPGTSPGTQTFGSTLDYSSTSNMKWELFSNTTSESAFDKVTASGAITIASGATLGIVLNAPGSTVSLDNIFWTQPRSWTFLTGSSISGSFTLGSVSGDSGGRAVSDYGTLSLQQSTNSATLVFTPYTPTDLWRQAHFGDDWNNPAIVDDDLDSDRDGLANLLEYALGTDPNISNTGSAPQSTTTSGKLKISFTRNSAATDLTFSVMATDDFTFPWTEIARSTHGAPFIAIAPEAEVNESGSGDIKNVETTDIYLITDPERPRRFMRVQVGR